MISDTSSELPPFTWEDVERFSKSDAPSAPAMSSPDDIGTVHHPGPGLWERKLREFAFVVEHRVAPAATCDVYELVLHAPFGHPTEVKIVPFEQAYPNARVLHTTYRLASQNVQAAMEELFTHAHRLLSDGRYETCDDLLGEFDDTACPEIVAVGLLRACFPVRDRLANWAGLLERVKPRLAGTDRERLLRGLG